MFQIRRGIFETNSSSSHSISIKKEGHTYTKEEIMKGIYVNEQGGWSIWDFQIEFGRSPFEPLTTFSGKIRFALASYASDPSTIEKICDIFSKYTEGCWLNLHDVEVDNDDEDEVSWYGKNGIRGYIDHQSIGVLKNFLKKHNVTLEEFLTNSKYIVWIDGDEYQIKELLFSSGLIDKNDFEETDISESDEDLEWEEYKREFTEKEDEEA